MSELFHVLVAWKRKARGKSNLSYSIIDGFVGRSEKHALWFSNVPPALKQERPELVHCIHMAHVSLNSSSVFTSTPHLLLASSKLGSTRTGVTGSVI
jgi:hypothetical protein